MLIAFLGIWEELKSKSPGVIFPRTPLTNSSYLFAFQAPPPPPPLENLLRGPCVGSDPVEVKDFSLVLPTQISLFPYFLISFPRLNFFGSLELNIMRSIFCFFFYFYRKKVSGRRNERTNFIET